MRAALVHPRLPLAVAILSVVLALPSLRVGWLADDHFLRVRLTGSEQLPEISGSIFSAFTFADGDPERTSRIMDKGFWPWWTAKELRASFFRPLAAITHWIDVRLWPDYASLMHLHSVLWLGGMVAAAALLYRRLMGPTLAAGLAALLFAIDDAHGTPVGFLANRNSLMATCLGLAALLAHQRWRRNGWRAGGVIGPMLFASSLLSSEFGIGTMAYLLAFSVFLDRGTWGRRLTSLLPYVLIVVVWRIVWTHLGHGIHGMDFYVDPLDHPLGFVGAVVRRAPVLLLGQWAVPPSEVISLGSVTLPASVARLMWLGAVVVLVLLCLLLWPLVRRDPSARFWALGMFLSAVPVCATYPADRMLLMVGIGAFGLLGQFAAQTFGEGHAYFSHNNGRLRRAGVRAGGVILLLVHAVVAPLALPFRALMPWGPRDTIEQCSIRTPFDDSIAQQDLVIVNGPINMAAAYLPIVRALADQPIPRRVRLLAPSFSPVVLHRPDEHTLVIRAEWGFLASPLDRLARGDDHPMALGQRVELTGVTVEVTALMDNGRPAEATCRFDVPLEDPSLRWLRWDEGAFVPFVPPPVGETVRLPAAIPSLGW